jgi:hypothetical protein
MVKSVREESIEQRKIRITKVQICTKTIIEKLHIVGRQRIERWAGQPHPTGSEL